MAFCAWWVFNFPIFLSGCLLFDVTIEVGMCESVCTHLICSGSKLTTREVAINVLFPQQILSFLNKKNWEIFTDCCFFHVAQLFPITSVFISLMLLFFGKLPNLQYHKTGGNPGGSQ